MIKIMIISHTFARPFLWKRWRLLSERYDDMDITLIAPDKWVDGTQSNYTFGEEMMSSGVSYESDHFHVHLIDMKNYGQIGWISKRLISELINSKPDIIFHIGTHLQDSLLEVILIKKLFLHNCKIIAFSMRGPQHCIVKPKNKALSSIINYHFRRYKLKQVIKNVSAIFCHYPKAKDLFIKEGFKKPIYIQTQVGVDTEIYKPNNESRIEIRKKLGLDDAFVFGSAVRFGADKGVLEVLEALPLTGNYKYLLMGSGTEKETEIIRNKIAEKKLSDKVIMPGFIDNQVMCKYWNAVDCAIHVPRTTNNWVETFSLALVQAMSTEICVIGNDSGSVPYEIGESGIIVPEGNTENLRYEMRRVMNDNDYCRSIAINMRQRAVNCFGIDHLTKCFHTVIIDVFNNIDDPSHYDMAEME